MDGKDATSHGSSSIGLERFEQIMKSYKSRRFGNTDRPPTPGSTELKDIVVQKKDHKKDA